MMSVCLPACLAGIYITCIRLHDWLSALAHIHTCMRTYRHTCISIERAHAVPPFVHAIVSVSGIGGTRFRVSSSSRSKLRPARQVPRSELL